MVEKRAAAAQKRISSRAVTKPVAGRAAAQKVHEAEHITFDLPFVGTVNLPPPEHLAYYAGIGFLVALEIIDWPIALLVAAGHALSQQQHSRAIQELGEGLEEGR